MSRHGFNVYPIITHGRVGRDRHGAGARLSRRCRCDARRGDARGPRSCGSPTRTIRPAPTCRQREVERLHAGLRPDILFVLDSAYAEYVTADDYDVGIELVDSAENVVMVRTFSKMGLADARIGWMYAPAHIVDVVNRIRGPFNVNRAAQLAGAAAARDTAFTGKAPRLQCAHARLADRGAQRQRHPRRAEPGQFRPRAVRGRGDQPRGVPGAVRRGADRARDRRLRHRERAPHFDRAGGRDAPAGRGAQGLSARRERRPDVSRNSPSSASASSARPSRARRGRRGWSRHIAISTREQETLDEARALGLGDIYTLDAGRGGEGRRPRHPLHAGRRLRGGDEGDRGMR